MAAKIKKGDRVVVMAGRDKGKTGEVRQVMTVEGRAIVAGVNMVRRHTKPSAQTEGGILSKESPIHLSNLAIADPKSGKPTRVDSSPFLPPPLDNTTAAVQCTS